MVKDGDTVSTGGFVSCACPEALTKALEKRFLETGHPRDLTLFFAAGQGLRNGTGGDRFGHEGMCRRVVGGHWGEAALSGLGAVPFVLLVGFGSFEVKSRAARTGRNPRTKEVVEIPASKVPVFKAGKALKDAVAK